MIFTDGACSNNQDRARRRAAAGVFISKGHELNVSQVLPGESHTNQRAELFALYKGLQVVETLKLQSARVVTDSTYAIGCVAKWYDSWERAGFVGKQNLDLIRPARELYVQLREQGVDLELQHVKAHTGKDDPLSLGNAEADRLATSALSTASEPSALDPPKARKRGLKRKAPAPPLKTPPLKSLHYADGQLLVFDRAGALLYAHAVHDRDPARLLAELGEGKESENENDGNGSGGDQVKVTTLDGDIVGLEFSTPRSFAKFTFPRHNVLDCLRACVSQRSINN
jgi:ribonuclease HI